MFEVDERDELRTRLIDAARRDPRVDSAALLGSAALGTEDRWSDIDLALRLAPGMDLVAVADEWTRRLEQGADIVDHLDIRVSGGLYRVFLLASTLQVDLSFWPHHHFALAGAPVQLLFGELGDPPAEAGGEDAMSQVRMAWLYALHVRSALARVRGWQAVWNARRHPYRLIAWYCLRHGLVSQEG
jgi:predicted nucleotidyltransferase